MSFKSTNRDIKIQKLARHSAESAAFYYHAPQEPKKFFKKDKLPLAFWAGLALASGLYILSIPNGIHPPNEHDVVATHETQNEAPDIVNTKPDRSLSLDRLAANGDIDLTITGSVAQTQETPQTTPHRTPTNKRLLGASIGSELTIKALSEHYITMRDETPALFQNLHPRVQFDKSAEKKISKLVTGPFTSHNAVQAFCDEFTRTFTTSCTTVDYRGYRIILSKQ